MPAVEGPAPGPSALSASDAPELLPDRAGKSPRPALWYRLTGALNRLIWQAPIPWRLSRYLSHRLYRSPPMAAAELHAVLDALAAGGVDVWVTGGWGVDALVGEQRRVHRDLDLMLDFADEPGALAVLASLGYREHYRVHSNVPTLTRTVVTDSLAQVLDLHPVELASMREHLARGTIGSRAVPCLSTSFQLAAHEGYKRRLRPDRLDLAVLRRLA